MLTAGVASFINTSLGIEHNDLHCVSKATSRQRYNELSLHHLGIWLSTFIPVLDLTSVHTHLLVIIDRNSPFYMY